MVNNTPVAHRRPRLNPFAFPSDTDLRFVLLLIVAGWNFALSTTFQFAAYAVLCWCCW